MPRQTNYIVHAVLLLLIAAISYSFLSKIPWKDWDIIQNQAFCTTIIDQKKPYSEAARTGKDLFLSKCASCHNLLVEATGPGLAGFEERGPWADRKNVYQWINNPEEFMEKDPYTRTLEKKYGSMMTAFPALTTTEIDAIIIYISESRIQN